jgi:endonuclease/exonuclease/phosphatase family metal-dependent hydrolase
VSWLAHDDPQEASLRRDWCEPVGPVASSSATGPQTNAFAGSLLIVSWNIAVGAGDVEHLVRTLANEERQNGRGVPDFVLLLQEAYRAGASVPANYTRQARVPRRIASGSRQGRDVESLAARLGMHFVYVPSMRNGAAVRGEPGEDRGNAILSTLPLRDLTAIELPLEHQRRVAVAARVDISGAPLTVVSVHLDARRPFTHGSVFAGPLARHRQAAALVRALTPARDAGHVIVGGDFNTVAGPREPAIRSMEEGFIRAACGSSITHQWGLPLDYMFASDAGVLESCRRSAKRFQSDHHPIVARIRTPYSPES